MILKTNKINYVLYCVIIVAIVVINVLTAIKLINHFNKESVTHEDIFSAPSEIVLHNGAKECSVYPDDDNFEKIVEFNEESSKYIEYYTPLSNVSLESVDAIWMEYKFGQDNRELIIPFDLEKRYVIAKRMCIILTGEYNGYICIDTPEGQMTIGRLNITSDYISLVENIVK